VVLEIRLADGWPYAWPRVFVDGMTRAHVNAFGEVCLWQPPDDSLAWLTFKDLKSRMEEWCEGALHGFTAADVGVDSHLYFRGTLPRVLATFDLDAFTPQGGFTDGASELLRATSTHRGTLRRLIPETAAVGATKLESDWTGRWFFRERLSSTPRDIKEFRGSLTTRQRTQFDVDVRGVVNVQRQPSVAMLVHQTSDVLDVLVAHVARVNGSVTARAIESAPSDRRSLLLRAGPDAAAIGAKRVVLFGAGAIGSQIALLLAESGLGALSVFDADSLRPGNVVRHLGSSLDVGLPTARSRASDFGSRRPGRRRRTRRCLPGAPMICGDPRRQTSSSRLLVTRDSRTNCQSSRKKHASI
jgi:hypothetical protein